MAPAADGVVDVVALRRLWDSVLDSVRTKSRTAHALMLSSQIESLVGNQLTLSFSSASLAERFARDVSASFTQALKEVVGVDLKVSATTGAGGAAPPSGSTEPQRYVPPTPAVEMTADDIEDSDDVEDGAGTDAEASALALLQEGLGAQVIGEIDQT
jgi:hypothetical protein